MSMHIRMTSTPHAEGCSNRSRSKQEHPQGSKEQISKFDYARPCCIYYALTTSKRNDDGKISEVQEFIMNPTSAIWFTILKQTIH